MSSPDVGPQRITPEQIEASAEAWWEFERPQGIRPWPALDDVIQDKVRARQKVALEAGVADDIRHLEAVRDDARRGNEIAWAQVLRMRRAVGVELTHGGVVDEIAQLATIVGSGHFDHKKVGERLDELRTQVRDRLTTAFEGSPDPGPQITPVPTEDLRYIMEMCLDCYSSDEMVQRVMALLPAEGGA